MRWIPSKVDGAWVLEAEPHADERGYFVRTWCEEESRAHSVASTLTQCSLSYNRVKGTLRGMHYQAAPHHEAKLVSCLRGAIFDVVLDLREDSRTYGQWQGVTLSETHRTALYVPPGCAHGFQTLEDDTTVSYMISGRYVPEAARGVRWNDARFGITWPAVERRVISARDEAW